NINKTDKKQCSQERYMMTSDKFLSSLCYFSVFFAPFLFPIMVWILTKDEVRYHSGKALWTHIVPYICIASGLITIAFTSTSPIILSNIPFKISFMDSYHYLYLSCLRINYYRIHMHINNDI